MAENPLVHVPAAWPVLTRANALRRRVVGRLRSFDQLQWDDVRYAREAPSQRLHIWEPDDLAPRDGWPALLLLHGGGWREGGWEQFRSLAPAFCRRGMVVAAMDYRLAPAHRWPAQLDDALSALDWLRGMQVDPGRVALWGHSAGAHLALLAGLHRPDAVCGVVALGAPTDLVRLAEEGDDDLDVIFDRDQLRGASPLHVPCDDPPPILLVHGTADRTVSVEHARALQARWPDRVRVSEVPDGDHGLRWPPVPALRARRDAMEQVVAWQAPAPRGSKWRRRRKP